MEEADIRRREFPSRPDRGRRAVCALYRILSKYIKFAELSLCVESADQRRSRAYYGGSWESAGTTLRVVPTARLSTENLSSRECPAHATGGSSGS